MTMKWSFRAMAFGFIAFSATQVAADPSGAWHCSAQGNIPLGLLTVSGSSYKFQAVKDTAWTPKLDPANGSGNLSITGGKLAPTSGPMVARLKIISGTYGPSGKSDYIDWFTKPNGYYLLRCLRP